MSMTRTTYSQKLKEAIEEIRPAFRELGDSLKTLTRKRAELAPAFLKAYALWKRETGRSQLAFIHALDPAVPVNDREGYRAHASYRAAQYLLGQATQPEKDEAKGVTPLHMLAVTIKSVMPLFGSQKDQMEALDALLAATKWRDTDRRRLVGKIRRARAVGLPKVPRLVDASKTTRAVVVAFERERLAS